MPGSGRRSALGIYIHFPYCDVKCAYCDFYSIASRTTRKEGDPFHDQYFKALKKDLLHQKILAEKSGEKQRAVSVFFGGGTPSKMPADLIGRIIRLIETEFGRRPEEISLEANPESVSLPYLRDLQQAGINRLNLGIQTRDPGLLHYLGRLHRRERYESALAEVAQTGFDSFGADLIYGIPGQSWRTLENDLHWLTDHGVKHVSAYALTLEPATALKSQVERGEKKKPSERRQVMHQQLLEKFLGNRGYRRYEISNYSLPGHECRHNLLYWKNRSYIGIGVAAHSLIGNLRLAAPRSLNAWLENPTDRKTETAQVTDLFLNGLRLDQWQAENFYKRKLPTDLRVTFDRLLQTWEVAGFLTREKKFFRMSETGLCFADSLILQADRTFSEPKP